MEHGNKKGENNEDTCHLNSSKDKYKSGIYSRHRITGRAAVTFGIAALILLLLLHLPVIASLIVWLSPETSDVFLFLTCLFIITILTIAGMVLCHFSCILPVRVLYLLSSLWIAFFFYLTLISIVQLILFSTLFVVDEIMNTALLNESWRIGIYSAGYGITFGITVLGFFNAERIIVSRIYLKSPKIRAPLRIAAISDVHVGAIIGSRFLGKINKILQVERPDILLVVGDMLDLHPDYVKDKADAVSGIFKKQTTIAVSGNHEFYNGYRACLDFLKECGAIILEDVMYVDEKTGVCMLGLKDPSARTEAKEGRSVIEKLNDERDSSLFTILLSHQPLFFDLAAEKGIELQVSGHTHGGQMWPFSLMTKAIFGRYYKGMHRRKNSVLYTLNGTGTWGPPLRIGARPEILIVDVVPEGSAMNLKPESE
ncbi:MAG: metallophosphoesterase [Thermoplasmata archaeon]